MPKPKSKLREPKLYDLLASRPGWVYRGDYAEIWEYEPNKPASAASNAHGTFIAIIGNDAAEYLAISPEIEALDGLGRVYDSRESLAAELDKIETWHRPTPDRPLDFIRTLV